MKKLSILILTLAIGLFVTAGSVSAKDAPAKGSWTGTLIDKHCGSDMAKDKLAGHEKACVMKCAANGKGLGVMVDGKWYALDAKGEKMAWKILKNSKATSDIQVTVAGSLADGKITVSKITAKA